MKKVFIICIAIAGICAIAFTNSSCKKETITVTEANPSNAQPIIIYFGKTYSFRGCKPSLGICVDWGRPRKDWGDYLLQADEAKGEAWAESVDNATSSVNYYLPEVSLSDSMYNKMILQRKFTFQEDTYVPDDLKAKLYKDAKITDVPAEMKIPAGDYPVVIAGDVPAPQAKFKIRIRIYRERDTIYFEIRVFR